MNKEVKEYIDATAKAMYENNLMLAVLAGANLYSAMEALLRSYKRMGRKIEDLEDYGFAPPKKSRDITVALPSGSVTVDWAETMDEYVRERMRSYLRTEVQYDEVTRTIAQFENNPYFIVIRMYYFNEDAYGNDLTSDWRNRTIEDIANELEASGFEFPKSNKTLSKKKTELVRDMTVLLFGKPGAVSIEMYKARKAGGST